MIKWLTSMKHQKLKCCCTNPNNSHSKKKEKRFVLVSHLYLIFFLLIYLMVNSCCPLGQTDPVNHYTGSGNRKWYLDESKNWAWDQTNQWWKPDVAALVPTKRNPNISIRIGPVSEPCSNLLFVLLMTLDLAGCPGPCAAPFVYLMWLTVCLPSRPSQALLSTTDPHWWKTTPSVSFLQPALLAHVATYCHPQKYTHEHT